jgi:hypothetical protein
MAPSTPPTTMWRKNRDAAGIGRLARHFGNSLDTGSAGANSSVPKATALAMLMLAATGWCHRRRWYAWGVSKLVNARTLQQTTVWKWPAACQN